MVKQIKSSYSNPKLGTKVYSNLHGSLTKQGFTTTPEDAGNVGRRFDYLNTMCGYEFKKTRISVGVYCYVCTGRWEWDGQFIDHIIRQMGVRS